MSRLTFHTHADLTLLQALATPVWIFDVDQHSIWWGNDAAVRFWGANTLEALRARDFSTDSQTVRTRLRQIVESEEDDPSVQDTWTLYPDGTPKTVIISLKPSRIADDGQGLLIEILEIVDAPQDGPRRILEAARATALQVSTFTKSGTLLAQNPAALECFGDTTALGGTGSDLERRFVDPALARDIATQVLDNTNVDCDAEMFTQQGRKWHRLSGRRSRDPVNGDPVIVLSADDITEQKKLQAQLQALNGALEALVEQSSRRLDESEERYALAVQAAAIWDWTAANNALFVSPNFLETLGYTPQEFAALTDSLQNLAPLLHPDDRAEYLVELDRCWAQPETPFIREARFLDKTGQIFWYQMRGMFILDDAGQPSRSVGLLTDISSLKELEQSLMASQRMEAVGQLTGGIAHDFNNLLTVIQGNVQLLDELHELDTELVAAITDAVQRGAGLIRHLLAFSRQQTLRPCQIDLGSVISRMSDTVLRTLGEEVALDTILPKALWTAQADLSQLEAALLNLCLNARDAMNGTGYITLSCRNVSLNDVEKIPDSTLSPGDYVALTVSDTGPGMSQTTASLAFEPFFTTKEVGEGSGLGLSMVQGFSRQSGGDTTIWSQPGEGTRVTLYLPRAEGAAQPHGSPPPLAQVSGRGEHIHLLEDNPQVQTTVRKTLEALGYRISLSGDVETALKAVAHGPAPDLVLADIILPGGRSGVDFANELRDKRPGIKIILMSGYPNLTPEQRSVLGRDYEFVKKPFERGELSRVLRRVLDS